MLLQINLLVDQIEVFYGLFAVGPHFVDRGVPEVGGLQRVLKLGAVRRVRSWRGRRRASS
jgi:hypothetical protein